MARGIRAVRPGAAPGFAALGLLILLGGGALLGLALAGGDASVFNARLAGVVWFTLWQAGLSALLSILAGLALALALHRNRQFAGRGMLLAMLSLPFALPALAGVLAMLSLYGRAGPLANGLAALGLPQWPGIYGLGGIVATHVFFNMPLAARLFLAALDAAPANEYRLAAQLGMDRRARLHLVEWPVLRAALPNALMLVFMLCMTSFAIVLLAGGGPAATTLEVAIYQALRFDFNPGRAAMLTLVQAGLAGLLAFIASWSGLSLLPDNSAHAGKPNRQYSGRKSRATRMDMAVLFIAAVYLAAPLGMIAAWGFAAGLGRLAGEAVVQRAVLNSLGLGLVSGLVAIALAAALALTQRRLAQRGGMGRGAAKVMAAAPFLVLVLPSIAIGSGWFLLLRLWTDPAPFAPFMVAAVNAAMALPFASGLLRPALDLAAGRHDRLCASLGISGWPRFALVEWPVMKRPLLAALALAMALSMGDLGVIALFGGDRLVTLPFLVQARMGSYRTQDAEGLALMLAVICLLLTLAAAQAAREKSE